MAQQLGFMGGMFGPTSNPWDEANNSIDAQAAKVAQLGAGYAAGSLAGRGVTQALGGLGLKPASVERAESLKEALAAARDPMGDMLTTYKNLAEELHRRGLVEEAMKAEQMYEEAKTKKLDSEMKRENLQSQIEARKERERTRAMLASAKLAGKPWGGEALKFYTTHAPKYSPESWQKWFQALENSEGNFQAATTSLQAVDGKVSYSDPYIDPMTGNVVQKDSRNKVVLVDSRNKLDVKVGTGEQLTDMEKAIKIVDRAMPPGLAADIASLERADALLWKVKAGGDGAARAGTELLETLAKTAKADSQLTKAEAERLRVSGGWSEKMLQKVNDFFSGKLTKFQVDEIEAIMAVKRALVAKQQEKLRGHVDAQFAESKLPEHARKAAFGKYNLDSRFNSPPNAGTPIPGVPGFTVIRP